MALRWRWVVLIVSIVTVPGGALRVSHGETELFPAGYPAAVPGRCLSAGRHPYPRIGERSPTRSSDIIQGQPGVTHVSSFIGSGGLRFLLVYTPERENPAYVEFLVNVDDEHKIDGLQATVQKYWTPITRTPMRSPRSFSWVQVRAAAFRRDSAVPILPAARRSPTRRSRSFGTTAVRCACGRTGESLNW